MENKKYEITDVEHETMKGLFRIRRLSNGFIGGFVSGYHNLSQDGECFIYDDACVYDNACVFEDARVIDCAIVCNDCKVFEKSLVSSRAKVQDSSKVYGNASVSGDSVICGDSIICGRLSIYSSYIKDGICTGY